MTMATLTSRGDDLAEFRDIHTWDGNEILIEYLTADGNPVGVAWGYNVLSHCTYEILDFTEPTGEHIQTVFGRSHSLHEGATAKMTAIVVTDEGEFPITILQHGRSRADTTGRWIREVDLTNWVSIL